MATFDSLADDVYVITNRPDLVMETTVAIRKAIRKCHGADLWKRDLNTVTLILANQVRPDPYQNRWQIDLSELSRFRRMSVLEYPLGDVPSSLVPAPLRDGSGLATFNRSFAELAADNLFDSYRVEKPNYFFVTGSVLNLKASWDVDKLSAVYWQWPLIPTDPAVELESWIAREYPDIIVEEACASVFKQIGKDDEHARYSALFAENMAILRGTDIVQG